MSKTCAKDVKIEFPGDIFTHKEGAGLVATIAEYLLYQRHQIPFIYQTFQYVALKWKNEEKKQNSIVPLSEITINENENFAEYKQRKVILERFDTMNNLKKTLNKEFKMKNVKAVRFVFGATPLTPKEIYIVKLPDMLKFESNSELEKQYTATDEVSIKKTLVSLLTCQHLYDVFSSNMPITNMFIDFQVQNDNENNAKEFHNDSDIFEKEYIDPPKKCTTVILDIDHKSNSSKTENNGNSTMADDLIKGFKNLALTGNNSNKTDENEVEENFTWYEANYVFRGFKIPTSAGNIFSYKFKS